MKKSDNIEFYLGSVNEARFLVNNTWVCFDDIGRVYVVEYCIIKKEFQTVPSAISWVRQFGDRD